MIPVENPSFLPLMQFWILKFTTFSILTMS